jgi:hypothetical protein
MAFGLPIQMGIFLSFVSHDVSARFDVCFSLAAHIPQVSEFRWSRSGMQLLARCIGDRNEDQEHMGT